MTAPDRPDAPLPGPSLVAPPLLARLAPAQRVLLAGCGGGFDVYSAIPLYLALRAAGKDVALANLSFMDLDVVFADRVHDAVWRIDADTVVDADYHPELSLCRWLDGRGEPARVFALQRTGTRALTDAYAFLADHLAVDALVLVDGGTDALMRGDEAGLGTPVEDASSIVAASELGLERAFLACVGFGVDHFHGVCHAQFLEGVAELARAGAFLGASSLVRGMPEVDAYLDLVRFANEDTPRVQSIVCNSVASAIEGRYGDHHATRRTQGSQLWINPLMALMWAFELAPVARRLQYRDELRFTASPGETSSRIARFRRQVAARPYEQLPI